LLFSVSRVLTIIPGVRSASLAKTYKELRILHFVFLLTWFLFILCIQVAKPQARTVQPTILYALAIVEIMDVAGGVALRKKRVGAPWKSYAANQKMA
jgi:hypothetical protein